MMSKQKLMMYILVTVTTHHAQGMKRFYLAALKPNQVCTFSTKKDSHNFNSAKKIAQEIDELLNPDISLNHPFPAIENLIFNRIEKQNWLYGVYHAQEIKRLQYLLKSVPSNKAWELFLKQKIKAERKLFQKAYLDFISPEHVDKYVEHVHNLYEKIIPKIYENKELSDMFWNNLDLNKKRWATIEVHDELNKAERRYFESRNTLRMACLHREGFDLLSLKKI